MKFGVEDMHEKTSRFLSAINENFLFNAFNYKESEIAGNFCHIANWRMQKESDISQCFA